MKNFLSLLFVLLTSTCFSQINFQPYVSANIDSRIVAVTIGDVNNDGLKDAVVANDFFFAAGNEYKIFVFLQQNDGSLGTPETYPYPSNDNQRAVIDIADLNNDGLQDVVISFQDSLGIFYQNVSGTLDPIETFYSGSRTGALCTGDLNNDGLMDIAVSHSDDAFINVFYQNEDANFDIEAYFIPEPTILEVEVADMNNDDMDDIVLVSGLGSDEALIIFYQDINGGINSTPTLLYYQMGYSERFNGIGIGDLNNDGRNDIAASMGGNTSWLGLIFQDENGEMGEATFIDAYDIPRPVEISDLNCDGKNEIVVGHDSWICFSVYEQDSLGQYNDYVLFPALYDVNPYGLDVGDFNDDGRPDVLTTTGSDLVRFVYNSSIPDVIEYTDTTVVYQINWADTTSVYTVPYCYSVTDTIDECIIMTTITGDLNRTGLQIHQEGDSLFTRNYEICGGNIQDTVVKDFIINKYVYVYDTLSKIFDCDTLYSEIIQFDEYSVFDTTNMHTEHNSAIEVLDDLITVNDTMYLVTDSLFVSSYVLIIEYLKKDYGICDVLKCGEWYYDTILMNVNPGSWEVVLESDTTLISHTMVVYPAGISPVDHHPEFKIYPNPATEFLHVECEFKFTLKLYSLQGKLLLESREPDIDLAGLPPAVYLVIMRDKDERFRGMMKILKQ